MRIGPYEVRGELGRGGMGVVYRARSPSGDDVAVKVLRRVDPEALARFERERRLLTTLGEAEGFVGLLDAGIAAQGAWLAMPFVTGGTLRTRLDAGCLGIEETVSLGSQLAAALGKAHERGIVHRDVKPENVIFTRSGRPLLADLGLAKHFDRSAPGASQSMGLTDQGLLVGSAGYMAPEQIDGASVGPPADVFALGAILHECLAGRRAFPGTTPMNALARLARGDPDRLDREDLPPWLRAVIERALSRDPRARFPDGASLARALAAGKPPTRGRWPQALAVGSLLLGVGVCLVVSGRTPDPAPHIPSRPAPRAAPREAPPVAPSRPEPADALAWTDRGRTREQAGDHDGAIADATRAIELEPGLLAAWDLRATAHGERGDPADAIADATHAIELDPRLARAWQTRGSAHIQRDELDDAIADETRAIEIDPRFAYAWAARGHARLKKHDREGALADETRAIEIDPGVAEFWFFRGLAHAQLEQDEAAGADMTRSIELKPTLAEPYFYRGGERWNHGDDAGGAADLQRYLELAPTGDNAAQARSVLEQHRAH
jgi:regulator of sirC expression with transglutaminase-like and TPR domain